MIHSIVRETLLGWHDSFIGRKRNKVWRAVPLCLFWTIWKERNRRSFENVELFVQRLKFLFLCTLLSWTNLFIENSFLVDFIDWLGSREYFCFPYPFWHYLVAVIYAMCVLVAL